MNGWGLSVKGGVSTGGVYANSTGIATASQAYNSTPVALIASTFNSSSNQFVSQGFQWLAEPVASNTANPSATLNLQYSSWTIPTPGIPMNDTGLSITSRGQLQAPAIAIGGGTPITNHVSILSPNVAFNVKLKPATCTDWSVPVAAAVDGDTVAAGIGSSLMVPGLIYSAWATQGAVSVRFCNPTGAPITVGSGNIRVDVWSH